RARTHHGRAVRMRRDARGGGFDGGEIGIGEGHGDGIRGGGRSVARIALAREGAWKPRRDPCTPNARSPVDGFCDNDASPHANHPMSEAAGVKPNQYLADYRPPAWRVEEVELEFDLDP